jgi:hypothetical protein
MLGAMNLARAGLVPLVLAAALAAETAAALNSLRFADAGDGSYSFNTGVLAGKLRSGGKSVGLLPVVYLPTGEVLTRSMGFAGHYRIFSGPHRFGTGAWYWPSTAKLLNDGSVEVHWPAVQDRPFDLWTVYRWSGPAKLDVLTRVRPQAELPDFETFLAWYFNESFASASVMGREGLFAAERSAGAWQMFPRDASAVRLIQDGRWTMPPNPVDWAIRPPFAAPLAVRRSAESGLSAVLMAPAGDCFAISTPHQAEAHFSMYLSLFGRTIRSGETARARTRMVILPSATPEQLQRTYGEFRNERR